MIELKNLLYAAVAVSLITFSGCGNDDMPTPAVETPASYSFARDGQTTVSFPGQTTRIQMATELVNAMKDFDNATAAGMLEMFRNATATGGDANPFASAALNGATKSVKSKVAASRDFFSANTVEAAKIRADFERWITAQVSEVFPNANTLASVGTAGQLADGAVARYVNAQGLEYDQAVGKSLIGALMLDQMLNHYLGKAVLDEADNRADNDNGVLVDGQNYTAMEHKWDEAFGYLYGTSTDPENPNATIGLDDGFLNRYMGRVENDADFAGIAEDVLNAFKLGRAAIVAGDYSLRDAQAEIIRTRMSEIIAIRAVYYLIQGKSSLESANPDYGAAFHDLSEGYGFIYSLRFTRRPTTDEPFFTQPEVDGFIRDLMGGTNGLWNVAPATLDNIANTIAAKFGFTVAEAGSTS